MKWFKVIYNCSLVSFLLAILCFSNEWLQMRVNTGMIFFASWLFLSFVVGFLTWRKQLQVQRRVTLVIVIGCVLISWLVLGSDSLTVVPAALLREGLHQPMLPFSVINLSLLSWLVLGTGLSLWQPAVQ